jgi:hypothetical protein
MLESLLAYPDFWKYVSIPFIAGAVGWTTNWMAVQMTFYPLEFLGIRPFFRLAGHYSLQGRKDGGYRGRQGALEAGQPG